MPRNIELAAHYNIDSNTVKVQMFVTDDCDNLFHPKDIISATIQLFNVFNLPETGLQEVPLESISFDKSAANTEGLFVIFFVNPSVNTNLEARATVDIIGQGITTSVVSVLISLITNSNPLGLQLLNQYVVGVFWGQQRACSLPETRSA